MGEDWPSQLWVCSPCTLVGWCWCWVIEWLCGLVGDFAKRMETDRQSRHKLHGHRPSVRIVIVISPLVVSHALKLGPRQRMARVGGPLALHW